MAVPPNLPTSFVPRQSFSASASSSRRPFRTDLGNAFAFFGYGIFAVSALLAVGVFAYSQILLADQKSKQAELAEAEASLDTTTVENLIKLRDRLASGGQLLSTHVALTPFFSLLEDLTLAPIRIEALDTVVNDDHSAGLTLSGIAKNFNALAAQSASLAKNTRVKDAIFSGIGLNKDGTVDFSLTAVLDPKLLSFVPGSPKTGSAPVDIPETP